MTRLRATGSAKDHIGAQTESLHQPCMAYGPYASASEHLYLYSTTQSGVMAPSIGKQEKINKKRALCDDERENKKEEKIITAFVCISSVVSNRLT